MRGQKIKRLWPQMSIFQYRSAPVFFPQVCSLPALCNSTCWRALAADPDGLDFGFNSDGGEMQVICLKRLSLETKGMLRLVAHLHCQASNVSAPGFLCYQGDRSEGPSGELGTSG